MKPTRADLVRYRVMAMIVGLLLVVLILVGVPLANFDGSPMWVNPFTGDDLFSSTPVIWAEGSTAQQVGDFITQVLGVAHGWLYMIFLFTAFMLGNRARWPMSFLLVTLASGTVPILSFWAERRATRRAIAEYPELAKPAREHA